MQPEELVEHFRQAILLAPSAGWHCPQALSAAKIRYDGPTSRRITGERLAVKLLYRAGSPTGRLYRAGLHPASAPTKIPGEACIALLVVKRPQMRRLTIYSAQESYGMHLTLNKARRRELRDPPDSALAAYEILLRLDMLAEGAWARYTPYTDQLVWRG